MAFSRSLLIKGLAGGLGACTACAGGVGIYKSVSSAEENIEKLTDKQLIDKAGLDCNLSGDDLGSDTKDCSVKTGGKINVKKEDLKEEGVGYSSGTQKLKVSRSTEGEYSKNLKFVVDSGDITLNKDGTNLTNTKLGQYETYEIVKEGGKYYLSIKDSAEKGKIRELGLPVGEGESYCKLLETGSSSCTLTEGEIKKVKFEGAESAGVTVTGGSVSLTITKTKDTSFTDGYRFTFTFPSEVTINGKTVKANVSTDFKIKKGDGNALTLEKAWGEENEFAKKAGLDCSNTEECTVTSPNGKLNIRIADKEKEGITSLGNGGGKIKLEKDQPGYNQGFKFTITTGDITPTDGGEIGKLEQYETYEITEKEGKYFLTRKTEAKGEKEKALGLLGKCEFPETGESNCTFDANEIKKVKFGGQDAGSITASGNTTLTITKTEDTSSFTDGYRFTFTFPSNVTISSKEIKANIPTDFKIKKGENNALSLEKAWEDNKLIEKVGLSCNSASGNECSVASSGTITSLSVKIGEEKKENITSINGGGGKIKLEKEQAGYNQGLKFTVSEGDVTLTGVSSPDNKLEELETYEITEEGGKYYLTRKTTKEDAIKKSLSIPNDCFNATPNSCSNLTTLDLSKINFDGKNGGGASVDSGRANLTISKVTNVTDFPLGYRFTFLTTGEMTISDDNKVEANIPTEFKIKKENNTLSLVKAWSKDSDLIAKVGLEGCTENGTDICTIKTTSTPGLNVKQGETTYDNKTKSNTSSEGKIKLYRKEKGYIEGLKFVIEENDITLDNAGGSAIKLTQYETYGIEEKDGKYYLSRKTDGKDEKIKKLGLPDHCKWEKSSSSLPTCSITQQELKEVKFKDKKNSDSQITTTNDGNIIVEFAEVKDGETTTHPLGLKVSFIFISTSKSEINIPLNSSPEDGAIVLKQSKKKEFRITKETNGGDLSLERTFDIDGFVSDVGLENCYDNLGCSLKNNLNVWLDENNYRVEAKVEGSSKEHKVTYEEKISGGYEFTLKSSITLQSRDSATETTSTGNFTTLNKGDKFQIKQHLVGRTNKYFLTKVSR